jgi:hypothetical protein
MPHFEQSNPNRFISQIARELQKYILSDQATSKRWPGFVSPLHNWYDGKALHTSVRPRHFAPDMDNSRRFTCNARKRLTAALHLSRMSMQEKTENFG